MKKTTAFLISIAITTTITTSCRELPGSPGDGEYKVKNVIDGDTVELTNGLKVRYTGIDTPETRYRSGGEWIFDPESFAVSARDFNRSLVYGNVVRLEFDEEKTDKYGRWLAYVFTDNGMMANEELIREGLAMVYTFLPNTRYYDRLIAAQEEARINRRGLWKDPAPILPVEAKDHIGQFGTVSGRVTDVKMSPRRICLYLDKDPDRMLRVVIFTRNLPLFHNKGIDAAEDYVDEHVVVTGKIEHDNGCFIAVDNPHQIKILSVKE